ncbi:MAG: DUF2854 domain-containing protein [Geitlerinemataceae cyanobacterium]
MLRKISLGSVAFYLGLTITLVGFWAYFTDRATLNLAGFFYGIPILLIGIALRTAQLKPVPYSEPTADNVAAVRDRYATETQSQIRDDVTRFRYAQEAHLIESFESLGMSPTDEERPLLTSIREALTDGAYTLVLEFDSPLMELDVWLAKQDKMAEFFGPDIRIEIQQPEEEYVDLLLISTRAEVTAEATQATEAPKAA